MCIRRGEGGYWDGIGKSIIGDGTICGVLKLNLLLGIAQSLRVEVGPAEQPQASSE